MTEPHELVDARVISYATKKFAEAISPRWASAVVTLRNGYFEIRAPQPRGEWWLCTVSHAHLLRMAIDPAALLRAIWAELDLADKSLRRKEWDEAGPRLGEVAVSCAREAPHVAKRILWQIGARA